MKQLFKNKIDKNGVVIRNIACLVVQEYAQVKGIGFHEALAHMVRLEKMRMLISIACTFQPKIVSNCCKKVPF